MKKPNLNLKRASVLTSTLLCSALLIAAPLRRELNEGWKFKQARLNNWYPATVPGVVHTDLMDNKIIEDPFFRLNERSMQWIDKEDWVYLPPHPGDDGEAEHRARFQGTGYVC